MCVAALAWDADPDWLLVAAGNRDEFHARPAAPLARWQDGSGILAGTDLAGGGTWLGVHEAGRFALVTNYRVPQGPQPHRPSRGKLVTDLLQAHVPDRVAEMNPFNLLLIDGGKASFLTNHPALETRPLAPGLHGLSNGGFDVPWPKTLQVQRAISDWLASGGTEPGALLPPLLDRTPDPALARPADGPEPRFAPVFIHDPVYGTRCSTVVAVRRNGQGVILERSFDADGNISGEVVQTFAWPAM